VYGIFFEQETWTTAAHKGRYCIKQYVDLSGVGKQQQQPYSLVICEKPAAALRVAQALGTAGLRKVSRLEVKDNKKISERLRTPVFHATNLDGIQFIICSAIGHLYGLTDSNNNRSVYPVFDVKWVPIVRKTRKIRKAISAAISEQIINTIAILSRNASRFIHACDYDQEGELIGYNILEYACKNKYEKSLRAKFSTLTDDEIRNSFDNLLKPSRTLAEAGRTRHFIDFIYGINLSRALTQSFKVSNHGKRYYNLSIGRVQGPTLAFVVDREIEIRKHIPVPYWNIHAQFEKNGQVIESCYYQQKIRTLSDATSIVEACKNESGKLIEIKSQKILLKAPAPFNLGDLQMEAYRVFKFSPSYTLTIAEKLYISALISYPRTSSQKIPPSINYKKIILGLSNISLFVPYDISAKKSSEVNQNVYKNLALLLLSETRLSPNEGSKTDPAHPAIYPTGEKPKGKLDLAELKLFDLIIKRFFATFGKPAISQLTTITIQVKDDHLFTADSRKNLYEGWMYYYKPYSNRMNMNSESQLPELYKDDILKNINITTYEKFSQPPPRFNQATLLKQMEKDNIGTKATRSDIISTLFKRNYIMNVNSYQSEQTNDLQTRAVRVGIEATDIGFEIIQSMRKYIPEIVSKDLTRSTEVQLQQIESGGMKSTVVLENAIDKLKRTAICFKKNEIDIGNQITDALIITRKQQQIALGRCPVCAEGHLKIIKSKRTKKRFVGCSNYTSGKCKAVAPLPQIGSVQSTGKKCSVCQWPIVKAIYFNQGSHPWKFCINSQCASKRSNITR
jgi:DNA topoisomerase-1